MESTKNYEETDHPAITVCVNNGGTGWRENEIEFSFENGFQTICNSSTNAAEAF